MFLRRTTFGWYDDDIYNVLFPFLILAVMLYGLSHVQNRKKIIASACVCFAVMTLYALYWHGWVLFYSLILFSLIISYIAARFSSKTPTTAQHLSLSLGIFALGTLLGITVIFGFTEFFILFEEGWRAVTNFLNPQIAPWPNLYIGVGELNKPTFAKLINLSGGYFYFGVAVGSLVWLIKEAIQKKNRNQILTFVPVVVFFYHLFYPCQRSAAFFYSLYGTAMFNVYLRAAEML
jgi:hypothetical protein